jgi:hypothetical protein
MTQTEIIKVAYLLGFEPTSDDLSGDSLYQEAEDFIYTYSINQ